MQRLTLSLQPRYSGFRAQFLHVRSGYRTYCNEAASANIETRCITGTFQAWGVFEDFSEQLGPGEAGPDTNRHICAAYQKVLQVSIGWLVLIDGHRVDTGIGSQSS